ncbi:MAG TPA: CpsB/CapC family capsule biosynthesis tyrosine phosphatase [Bryobacteraceae bacterium]|nr:CpsB/CapC family capsule biosynthesis tyrosine phosphatase [Bryobacteraceae bacterium]
MIDIHSHILPELDDGARDPDEALTMLRMAEATGTTDIVATPHSDLSFRFDPRATRERIADLQEAAGQSIRIHFGCELHLTMDGIENALRCPEDYSIGRRGHLLVEFSNYQVPKNSTGILLKMLDRGLRPIVAHPERNPIFRDRISELEAWVRMGCSMQVTAHSLLGRFGKAAKTASHQLIERGLVHFLASDAHDRQHRPPLLAEVRHYVDETFEPEAAELWLLDNPRAALEGFPVSTGAFRERKRPWYSFW